MKKFTVIHCFIIFCLLFCISCDKESYEAIIIVAPEYSIGIDPVSAQEVKSLNIREIGGEDYWFSVQYIDGFDYEEGYEYLLKVEVVKYKNPPIDMSGTKYKLIEILSKSKNTICNKKELP